MTNRRPRRPDRLVLASCLACLAAGLGLPSAAGAEGPKPGAAFSPGETLAYEVSYLGVMVGRVTAVVGATTEVEGRKVWPIMGIAKTDPLYTFWPVKDRFVTWWDPATGTSIGSDFHADHNHWRRRERVRYDRAARTASFTCEKEYAPRFDEKVSVQPDTRDVVAAIFTFRGRRLAVGDREEVSVYTGKRVFPMKLEVVRTETIETGVGKVEAVVAKAQVEFSDKLAVKSMNLYFSNDSRHLPLRLDAEFAFGSVIAELHSWEKGVSQP